MPLYLAVLALVPAFFLLFFVWLKDRYEREPLSLVLWTFGSGILSALLALVIEFALQAVMPAGESFWQSAISAFVQIAAVEEACKLLVVYVVAYRNPNFNEPMDGIVYAGAASLGFAAFENLLYVFKYGPLTGMYRAVLAVPAHFLFGVAMGYYLARFRFGSRQKRLLMAALAYLMPVLLHGLFDVVAMNMGGGTSDSASSLAFGALMYALMGYLWLRGGADMDDAQSRSPFRWRARRRSSRLHSPQRMLQVVGHCVQCGAGTPDEANYCYRCGVQSPLHPAVQPAITPVRAEEDAH